jgi:sigma-E factor negative regulatory protein RseA
MDDSKSISNERISALMDGALRADECAHVLNEVLADKQSIETWHVYHVVGEALRGTELAPIRNDLAFLEKLEQRLLQEPARPFAGLEGEISPMGSDATAVLVSIRKPVANDSLFRWKALAGVACSALVAVVAIGLLNQADLRGGGEVASAPAAFETSVGPMLRDPRLDELMAAHRQLGGHSALQVPAGFLRNATYEGNGR